MRIARTLLVLAAAAAFGAGAAPLDDLARKAANGSAEAKQEIERQAAAGHADAEHLMGMMHVSGKGAEQSDSQALEWFLRAARKGRDDKVAVRWMRRAAVQGYADAEFSLGLAYAEGRGVKLDAQEAYGWMLRASRRGHKPAIAYVKDIQGKLEEKGKPRK